MQAMCLMRKSLKSSSAMSITSSAHSESLRAVPQELNGLRDGLKMLSAQFHITQHQNKKRERGPDFQTGSLLPKFCMLSAAVHDLAILGVRVSCINENCVKSEHGILSITTAIRPVNTTVWAYAMP